MKNKSLKLLQSIALILPNTNSKTFYLICISTEFINTRVMNNKCVTSKQLNNFSGLAIIGFNFMLNRKTELLSIYWKLKPQCVDDIEQSEKNNSWFCLSLFNESIILLYIFRSASKNSIFLIGTEVETGSKSSGN